MATLIKKYSENIPGIGIPFNEVDVNTWSRGDYHAIKTKTKWS